MAPELDEAPLDHAWLASMTPTTPDDIARAKAFAMSMWRQRALELGRPEPTDLSDACKFCSLFAQGIFGGSILAHDFHCWTMVDGEVIDLAEDGRDVLDLADGRVPTSATDYANRYGLTWNGDDPYEADVCFMARREFVEAMESCIPRTTRWIEEWNRLEVHTAH